MSAEKKTFVQKRHETQELKKKGLWGLLALYFVARKQAVTLIVAGMLVAFVFGAPFGFDLGRVADFLADKPGIGWLATALRAADTFLDRAWASIRGVDYDGESYRELYTSKEEKFNWEAYKAAGGGANRDSANPESLVAGGKDLLDEGAQDKKTLKEAEGDGPVGVLHPDDAAKSDPVVEVPAEQMAAGAAGEGAGKGQLSLASLGGASAFGSKGLFSGPVGAAIPKDSLLQALSVGGKDGAKAPSGTSTKAPKVRLGKMSRFETNRDRHASGKAKNLLAIGTKYRFRLASASYQTGMSTTMETEDSAVWNRAWATGEKDMESMVDPDNATPPVNPNVNPESGAGGDMAGMVDTSIDECKIQGDILADQANQLNTDAKREKSQLEGRFGAPPSAPECCDDGDINFWNQRMANLRTNCLQWNGVANQAAEKCPSSFQPSSNPCEAGSYPILETCGDMECCIAAIMDALGPLGFWALTILTGGAFLGLMLTINLVGSLITGDWGGFGTMFERSIGDNEMEDDAEQASEDLLGGGGGYNTQGNFSVDAVRAPPSPGAGPRPLTPEEESDAERARRRRAEDAENPPPDDDTGGDTETP